MTLPKRAIEETKLSSGVELVAGADPRNQPQNRPALLAAISPHWQQRRKQRHSLLTGTRQHHPKCLGDYIKIHHQAPLFDIFQIQLNIQIKRGRSPRFYLPQSG